MAASIGNHSKRCEELENDPDYYQFYPWDQLDYLSIKVNGESRLAGYLSIGVFLFMIVLSFKVIDHLITEYQYVLSKEDLSPINLWSIHQGGIEY